MKLIKSNIVRILGFTIFLFSFLFPRNKSKWVFGLQRGFADNAKYYLIYIKQNYPEIRCIWIASSKNDQIYLLNKGIESYLKWSLKGIYHSLTSKVYIFAYGVGDINVWTSGGALRVNLWHGVGLKNLYFKANYGSLNKEYWEKRFIGKLRYWVYLKSNLFLSTSQMMSNHFSECFQLSYNNIIEGFYPRCLPLLMNENERKTFIDKWENDEIKEFLSSFSSYKKIILYMPTFRDNKYDFINKSGINFLKLNQLAIKENFLILIKLHQNTKLSFNDNTYKNIKIINNKLDIYPILPYTDLLITDYSSIYYDYIILNKKIILFPFDLDEYIKNNRDLAFDYYENTCSPLATTFDELFELISNEKIWKEWEKIDINKLDNIKNNFWNHTEFNENYLLMTNKIIFQEINIKIK